MQKKTLSVGATLEKTGFATLENKLVASATLGSATLGKHLLAQLKKNLELLLSKRATSLFTIR